MSLREKHMLISILHSFKPYMLNKQCNIANIIIVARMGPHTITHAANILCVIYGNTSVTGNAYIQMHHLYRNIVVTIVVLLL